MARERVRKVAAIVLRGSTAPDVLVFDHPLDGDGVMVQLPAGTVGPDEAPEAAVVRELLEETGVRGRVVALAGVRDEEWQGEVRRRWVYVLRAPDETRDAWPFQCDCGAPTRCHWLPFDQAQIVEPQQPWLDLARAWSGGGPAES